MCFYEKFNVRIPPLTLPWLLSPLSP
jgi:hypothetical protein